MSVLKKTPYVEQLLAKLSDEERTTLNNHFNYNYTNVFYSLLDSVHYPPESDTIDNASLQLTSNLIVNGFYIKNETTCVFIAYAWQNVTFYEIDYEHKTYKQIFEYCDINELRRCLYEAQHKDNVNIDKEGNVEFGKNVEIDGSLKVNKDVTINGGTALHTGNVKTIFGNKSLLKTYDEKGNVIDGNIDLYEHLIQVKSGNTLFINFVVISSKNLPIDSVQDFRTVMGETVFNYPISSKEYIESTATTLNYVASDGTKTTLLDKTWTDDVTTA